MTNRKHTHTAHCQLCDREQAANVKTTRVAKHGYTKRWGFFNGTCPGSDHLPYEYSADLIPSAIASVVASIANLTLQIERVRDLKNSDPTYGVVRFKRPLPKDKRRWGGPSDERIAADGHFVAEKVETYGTSCKFVANEPVKFQDGTAATEIEHFELYRSGQLYSVGDGTPADCGAAYRKGAIAALDSDRKQRESYRTWLDARLTNWKRTELTPVVVKHVAAPGVSFPYGKGTYRIVREDNGHGYRRAAAWQCEDVALPGRTCTFSKAQVTKILNRPEVQS